MDQAIEPRDVVQIDLDKRRIAIVVRLSGEFAEIVYGQATAGRGHEHVLVKPETRAGKALQLYKDTYFAASHVRLVRISSVQRIGRCPPGLYLDIREIAEAGRIRNLVRPVPPVTATDLRNLVLEAPGKMRGRPRVVYPAGGEST